MEVRDFNRNIIEVERVSFVLLAEICGSLSEVLT